MLKYSKSLISGGRRAVKSRIEARQVSSESRGEPKNEPILDYLSDGQAKHRVRLEQCLREMRASVHEVPIVIGGKEYHTNLVKNQLIPFEHSKALAKFSYATHELIAKASQCATEARREWEHTPLEQRARVFERAADLVSTKHRARLNAATMLGQAKVVRQAEIDSAAELADFLRFNSHFARKLLELHQPSSPSASEHNSLEFRGLEGFVAAISPFNFTAIGANLVAAPALMGNCLVWKPSDTAILSNYLVLKVLEEAGLPAGVINFVPSEGLDFGRMVTGNSRLAGVNFTGSLGTFQWLWSEVGLNIKRYDGFPRLVGECGGKNFHLVHESADLEAAAAQTVRSAFEYSGQKCSACSRLYVASSKWASFKQKILDKVQQIRLGPADQFDSYTSAVIDANADERVNNYLNYANAMKHELTLVHGGASDNSVGYYIEPTIYETRNPRNRLMQDEIFGPILTVYVYQDKELERTLELIDESCYALTGSIFAQDEKFLDMARTRLRMAAGNLYINDKSTGAVVGQQPFGGARHSGTNDKAGGPWNLMRWCNQLTIKRNMQPSTQI